MNITEKAMSAVEFATELEKLQQNNPIAFSIMSIKLSGIVEYEKEKTRLEEINKYE